MRFFLGGHDLEMLEIARLVRDELGPDAVVDRQLPWHAAKASVYAGDIRCTIEANRLPVLVELDLAGLPDEMLAQCHVVDHHGEHAGADRPTAIEQAFALLQLPRERWTRRLALVAANDRGWIPELRAAGASPAEIEALRREDRAAQGITPSEEADAGRACREAVRDEGSSVLIVRMNHSKTSPAFDRLALAAGTNDPPDTLIVSPDEYNFSGDGARVLRLAGRFADGWYGGALPVRGFWGHSQPLPDLHEVLRILTGRD